MRSHAKTALGIDITERRISAVLVEQHEHGFKTVAQASSDLPEGELKAGRSAQGTTVSQVLRQLGNARWARGVKTAVAVSTESVVMQILDMPRQATANVGEFVEGEFRQYVVLSGKTIVSDFCGIGPGGGVHRHLLVAAAEATKIRENVVACCRAGAAVDVVEPAALAYARAFLTRQVQAEHGRMTVLAVLDAHNLTTGVFAGVTPEFVRVRAIPADCNSVESLCAWLAEELRAVTRFCDAELSQDSRRRQIQVVVHDNVYSAEDIERRIAAEAEMGLVAVADSCECTGDPATAQKTSMVAVGAALRLLNADSDDMRINLLPREVVHRRSLSRHMLVTANVAAVVFLCLFLAAQLLARTTEARNRKIEHAKLSEELHAARALIGEEKFTDQQIASLRGRLGSLHRAIGAKREADWPAALHAVARATPPEVHVTHWLCDGMSLSLRGLAPSCDVAQVFVKRLESENPFASVSLAKVQRRQDDGSLLEYRIDCLVGATR